MEDITMSSHRVNSDDCSMFMDVFNQGIDSRLEAFVKSKGEWKNNRLFITVHPDELSIFFRRMIELESETADQWINDLLEHIYKIEVY